MYMQQLNATQNWVGLLLNGLVGIWLESPIQGSIQKKRHKSKFTFRLLNWLMTMEHSKDCILSVFSIRFKTAAVGT